jgi:hypothetical protein
MFRRFLPVLIVLAAATAPGCAAVARFEAPSAAAAPRGETTTVRSLGFLWGLVPPNEISLDQCGAPGIQKMKVKQGLIDFIITSATGGLVISYKVKITCAGAGEAPAAPANP